MTRAQAHPGDDAGRDTEIDALQRRIAQLERMNEAMMNRIERTIDSCGNAYSVFEANIVMQRTIEERTEALALANKALREEIAEKERAEQLLAMSRDEARRLATVAERTDNAVIITDHLGQIEWVNKGFTRITGYALGEVLGRTPGSLLQGPDTDRATIERIGEAIRARRGFSEELINYAKDGHKYWVQVDCRPILDESGSFNGFMALESDITERKLIMEEIRTLAVRLQMATEGACVGVWDLNLETNELVWDETMYSIYGIDPNHFGKLYESWRERLHPDDLDHAVHEFEHAIRDGVRFESSFRILLPSGEVRHIDAVATVERNAAGRAVRVVGVNQDITDQILAQASIRRAAMNLEHSGRLARVGGWELDLRTKELYWSTEVRRIHEVDDDFEPSLENAIEFYAEGESRRLITDSIESAIEHGAAWDIVTELITARGNHLWVRAMGETVYEDGVCVRLTGAFQDVTQQKRVELELQQARIAAEEANRAKSAFLANMSHEIRTPMTAIVGYAELMSEPTVDEPTRKEHTETIRRNGEHLLTIINDILDISKIEAGKMTIEHLEVSPQQIIEEIERLMNGRASAKNLTFETVYEGPIPAMIQSDPVRFRQILVNLVGNAIKFTEVGGVTLAVSFDDTGAAPALVVRVRDTGIGMSEDDGEHLFKNFAQADVSMTRRYGGTGLGLQISKRLAEMLGGGITFTSDLGVGSEFVLRIATGPLDGVAIGPPAQRGEEASEPTHEVSTSRDLTGRRVLLVEDGPDNQRLISYYLRRAGAEVTVAENGYEGIDVLEHRGPFDVVLMDMQMPVMDGYTATKQLRSAGVHTPIIALTAHAMSGDRERCLGIGCNDYATKPIEREKLLRLVVRWGVTNALGDAA